MLLPPHRSKNQGDDDITFPNLGCWNPQSKVATIAAMVKKNRVLCKISLRLLKTRFNANTERPLQAIKDNRAALEAAAQRAIQRDIYEEDGSVTIRAEDI